MQKSLMILFQSICQMNQNENSYFDKLIDEYSKEKVWIVLSGRSERMTDRKENYVENSTNI